MLYSMSKKAFSDSSKKSKNWKPDNPQETFEVEKYYYAGFFAAEMTCSVIKATNYNPVGHYYYTIDITVSNADKKLLNRINAVVMSGDGIISEIKGAYNLSSRGKTRVFKTLSFLDRYPIIAGDLARNRVELIKKALVYLTTHRGSRNHKAKTKAMDDIRKKLRAIKEFGVLPEVCKQRKEDKDSIGYFLSGILDGEGSFGVKRNNLKKQPFFVVAMKDAKIIKLLKEFLRFGRIRKRKDGVYHYELNHPVVLRKVCLLFTEKYPLRSSYQRARISKLQRILNDYTRNSDSIRR